MHFLFGLHVLWLGKSEHGFQKCLIVVLVESDVQVVHHQAAGAANATLLTTGTMILSQSLQ